MSAEGTTLVEQEVSAINKQIAEAQADLAEKQARYASAQTQIRRGGGADIAAALGSDTVSRLRGQRAEVSRQKADLETRYGPLHPEVQKISKQLVDYDKQIQEELARIQSSLGADVQVANQRLASLIASRDAAKAKLAASNSAEVGLMELQRRAEASKAIYEAFLNRSKEVAAQASIQRADAQVVSKAQVPVKPSAPNTKLNLALGLAFAIAAGLASVVSAEALDGAFHTSREVQSRLGLPALGSIPTLESVAPGVDRGTLKPEDYVVQRPRSAFAEAFRGLKTALLYGKPGQTVQVVAVTSAMPEEGKTLSTLCLGRVAAQGGSKVVIVDCDLRHRSLSGRLPGVVKTGLFEVLKGSARLEDVLKRDEPSGAWILPIAENAWSDPDVFRSPQMEALLASLRERFDLILLDTPPVLAVSDTRVLATVADSVLYLLRWGKTPEAAAENALEQLQAAGAFVPGVALTQVDIRRQVESGYGDSTYYYQSFQKYYAD
jgi:capsular exopolysaccharide synthesis family protein